MGNEIFINKYINGVIDKPIIKFSISATIGFFVGLLATYFLICPFDDDLFSYSIPICFISSLIVQKAYSLRKSCENNYFTIALLGGIVQLCLLVAFLVIALRVDDPWAEYAYKYTIVHCSIPMFFVGVFIGSVIVFINKKFESSTKSADRVIPLKSNFNSKSSTAEFKYPAKKAAKDEQHESLINLKLKSEDNNSIQVKSAFNYKGATIIYKVKIENPTSEPIADLKVTLFVPDVFLLSESTKNISIIKPGEGKTVSFEIRPTGECGDCEISGKVVYYDYSTKKTTEIYISPKNLSIICPMLHAKTINENEWRSSLSNLSNTEETTKDIDMPASTLFEIIADILKDMNLYMLEPKINDSINLYRAAARFYGEGVKDLKYAAQIEVVGGPKKSKLILKAWAEAEEALTGFYHGILDEIEKRVQVKGLIDNTVVYNHYGDKIGTQVKDSFLQRSNVGDIAKNTQNDSKVQY